MTATRSEAGRGRGATVPAQHDGQPLRHPSPGEQRRARIMGAWFLGTFVFSIPAYFFYDPLLGDPAYVIGDGQDTRVAVGAFLEILLAVSGIATAVVIFPVAKRVSESVALGYVAARTVESLLILVGVTSLMTIVALRPDAASDGDSGWVDIAGSLLAVHEQTSLLGPQFCAGLGNGILLGFVMWRSRLLPRPMVMFGLVGGPLALVAGTAVLIGPWTRDSVVPALLTAPEAIWELSLSLWLLIRGFRPSPVLTGAPVGSG